jgi:signal transduction histidine kinase/ligand-binding sensor domain-containing protein
MKMIKIQSILLFIFFFFINLAGYSQPNQIYFDHISLEDGLSQSSVYAICKDSKGFLWFGTAEGLNRYDGYKFVVYKVDLDNSNSVSDSWITCIYEDSFANLWIGTHDGGLNLFNYNSEKFTAYKNDKQDPASISNNTINAICEGDKGILWIATKSGLNKLNLNTIINPDSKEPPFTRYEINNDIQLNNEEVLSLCYTAKGELWIGTNGGGISQMVKKTDSSEVFINYHNQFSRQNSPCNDTILSIFQDINSKDFLWITNSGDIEKFNTVSKQFNHYNEHQGVSDLLVDLKLSVSDKEGNIWISTFEKGLIKFDTKAERFYLNNHNNNDISTLSSDDILSIYEDNEGILWIGTNGSGINKKRNKKFSGYRNNPDNPKSLNGKGAWAVYKDKSGTIWVGTESGLNRLDRKTDEFSLFSHDDKDNNSLSDNHVNSIFEDKDGDFWIGTSRGGLNLFDRSNGTFKHFRNETENVQSISSDFILPIVEDEDGYLWIGSRNTGLNKFDKKKGVFKRFINIPNCENCLSHNRVNALLLDKSGILWIGTSGGGLNKFDRNTEKFTSYKPDSLKPSSINNQYVLSLCEDKAGNLWVGTYDGGLNLFDRKNETFKHYTEKNGLPNNVIYGILEDKSGRLWLSTNKGLSLFNPSDEKFENFDVTDGLQNKEFNSGAYCKSSDGEMLFGGISGFNIFSPEKMITNTVIPPIVLTELKIINKKVAAGSESPLKNSIVTGNEINLSYRDYIFSIEFAALSFISPKKNKYAYKLEGFDKDWITTDYQNRIATYSNLAGGTYIFHVKASNNDGIWNETGTSIKIIISPPWWKTKWFILFLIIFGVASLFGIYRWRLAALRNQKIRLEQAVNERTREVYDQKEELNAINEELKQSNEELLSQREEMETLNEELASAYDESNNSRAELQLTLDSLQSAQEKLIQSEKMVSLGVLAAGIAHEINNPLNFIQGGTSFMESFIKDNFPEKFEEIRPVMEGINTGVNRATAIVKSLNQYSRSDSLALSECNINEIVDDCLIMLQNQFKSRIEVQRQYTEEKYIFEGNEGRLHQAFLNVLANAGQSIDRVGVISILTALEQGYFQVIITDNGHGISPENSRKIFEPFYTTKEPGRGTGLGLSITYNIIQEHNGKIGVESLVGEGTKVIIKLPVKMK